ncbi:MAG: CBS domain-containing protein [Candidatus Hodarchaeaceae archaeon]|nr:CBS domain-containing protein [Candidatus Hodarchaeaceae archaeon]
MRRLPHVGYKSRDRGPLEFKSRLRREEGNIMPIARRNVLTIPPTVRIKDAAELMVKNKVRRLPITDPGTKRLIGIVTTRDIIDFLGGGERSKIIQNKFKGNFLAAVNDPIRTIMSEKVVHGTFDMSIKDVAKLLLRTGVGGAPILDERAHVVGMVSERDFVPYVPIAAGILVGYHMTRKVVTAEPELQIKEAARRMVSRGVRRLPVVCDRELVGIVTSVDILRYFGTSEMFEHMAHGRVDEAMSVGVDRIMTSKVLTVTPQTDIGEAAALMVERGCGGLPVVERDELVGIMTERNVLELLI